MNTNRVIPVLLLQQKKLVKTMRFKNPVYIGDPINAVKIFNDKEVDELVILDIEASRTGTGPDIQLLRKIVSEAFMPVGYGGGVRTAEDAKALFNLGLEKVIVNSLLLHNPREVSKMIETYGSQSIVACLDYKSDLFGRTRPCFTSGTKSEKRDILSYAKELEALGVGEIVIQSVDRDGTGKGYDVDVLKRIAPELKIPVVIVGGASTPAHFREAFENGASAVGAGSMFVFQGKHRAVLISYTNKY